MSKAPVRSPKFLAGQPIRRNDTDAVGRFVGLDYPQAPGDEFLIRGDWYNPGDLQGPMLFETVPARLVEAANKNACAGHCGAVACVRSFGHVSASRKVG